VNKDELKSKRAAIRREIKERMQDELDERKKEIKRRIKRGNISVEEKRERYRREVRREKLQLMELAKQEFRARKRMLGSADEEEDYGEEFGMDHGEFRDEEYAGTPEMAVDASEAAPPWQVEEDLMMDEDDDLLRPIDAVAPQEAFILETTTEEREALRQYEGPINEADAFMPGNEQFEDQPAAGPPAFVPGADSGEIQAPNLFYYVWNLIFHPIQTLDEFDEYIAFPSGLRNVAIFYLVSILPIVIASYVSQNFGGGLGEGMASAIAPRQSNMLAIYAMSVFNLLLYSLSIASVSYLFTSEANFVTLTTYFAFVEGVARIVAYALVIGGIFVGVMVPSVVPFIVLLSLLLYIGYLIWVVVLTVIVLMSTYGHGGFVSFLLAIGGLIARIIATIFIGGLVQELVG
jgi:hypothetical protein